jgi:hypothetical protein
MTIAKVRSQIKYIEKMKGLDMEKAHSLEDELLQDVLRAIAKGSKKARALAQEALKSLEIDMSRHCA